MRRNNADKVVEYHSTSTRGLSVLTGETRTAVQDTFRENGLYLYLYLYHYQPVQETTDLSQKIRLCEWWINHLDALSRTLFCNESTFPQRTCAAIENPQAVRETDLQERFSISVCAGITNNEVVRPYFLDGNLKNGLVRTFWRMIYHYYLTTCLFKFEELCFFT